MKYDKILQKLNECAANEEAYEQLKSVFDDIQERLIQKTTQLELLEASIEKDYDSILITDLNLEHPGPRIAYVSPGFCKMTGYTKDEVIGQTPRILQGPKTDRATLMRLTHCLKNGQSFFGQAVNYRKDGTEFINQWDIHPLSTKDGEITHWVSYQHDITERKNAEKILFDSSLEFDQLDEESKSIFVDIDVQGNILTANKSFRELSGYTAANLKEIKIWDIFDGEFSKMEEVYLEKFKSRTPIPNFQAKIKHSSGKALEVEVSQYWLEDESTPMLRMKIINNGMKNRVLEALQKSKKKDAYELLTGHQPLEMVLKYIEDIGSFYVEYTSADLIAFSGDCLVQYKGCVLESDLIPESEKEMVKECMQKTLSIGSVCEDIHIKTQNGLYEAVTSYFKLSPKNGDGISRIKWMIEPEATMH